MSRASCSVERTNGGKDAGAVITEPRAYSLSFTSGSLLLSEANVAVSLYLQERDWARVRAAIHHGNLLQSRTASTGHRRAREITQRLSTMTESELELLAVATSDERAHLMWVAACRRYTLVGEFAEEVVRERFLTLAETLSYENWEAFLAVRAMWHDEIGRLADSTKRKLCTNVFRMLFEAGMLSSEGNIVPALLSDRVAELLDHQRLSDVRLFPARRDARGV